MHQAVIDAINKIFAEKDEFLAILKENVEVVLSGEESDEPIAVETRLNKLQHELLRPATFGAKHDLVAEGIHKPHSNKAEILSRQIESLGAKQRIEDLVEFLTRQSKEIKEYDEVLVRRLIEKLTVLNHGLVVEFKSGLEVGIS